MKPPVDFTGTLPIAWSPILTHQNDSIAAVRSMAGGWTVDAVTVCRKCRGEMAQVITIYTPTDEPIVRAVVTFLPFIHTDDSLYLLENAAGEMEQVPITRLAVKQPTAGKQSARAAFGRIALIDSPAMETYAFPVRCGHHGERGTVMGIEMWTAPSPITDR